jgi:hypothetical protein
MDLKVGQSRKKKKKKSSERWNCSRLRMRNFIIPISAWFELALKMTIGKRQLKN